MSVCYSSSCIYDKEALSITASLDGEVHQQVIRLAMGVSMNHCQRKTIQLDKTKERNS